MDNEYPIPEETAEMFLEYVANLECRDVCVKSVFRVNKAIKFGKQAEKARLEFWRMVNALYPETVSVDCNYDRTTQIVTTKDQ